MVMTVARSLATQYALALVTLHLRIKLNIVSRHYLLEVAEAEGGLGERGGANKLSDLTKRRFLSMEHLYASGTPHTQLLDALALFALIGEKSARPVHFLFPSHPLSHTSGASGPSRLRHSRAD